ncbi:MAG: MFS transporter [Hyphomicrobium sp.]|nr:MFS transporter [Hyphomicrobium sp.]
MQLRSEASEVHSATGDAVRLVLVGLTAFLTVVDLFAAQALLPALSQHYAVSPAAMGTAVNSCTLGMAVGGLTVALYGHRIPRRMGIIFSLVLLAVPTLLLASAPTLAVFMALRIVQGVFMSAAFGLTLAYLGERYMAEKTGSAFAAYITGNVASNLVGRLLATSLAASAGLPATFVAFSMLNLAGAALVYFTVDRIPAGSCATCTQGVLAGARAHLRDPALRSSFAIGFCILFAFIGTFTYINYELLRAPLSLDMMQLGFVYFVFLPSIISTPLAARSVAVVGVRPAMWGGLTIAVAGLPLLLVSSLPSVLGGMVLVAAGTFFAQAVATGFVSRAAQDNKPAASGIYLASYFIGGLAGSAILGFLYESFGWAACVAGVALVLLLAAVLARYLHLTTT